MTIYSTRTIPTTSYSDRTIPSTSYSIRDEVGEYFTLDLGDGTFFLESVGSYFYVQQPDLGTPYSTRIIP